MDKRFMAIWFRHLTTDWLIIRQPVLKDTTFVFALPERGRIVITAASKAAEKQGIHTGMPVADAKSMTPSLQVFDEKPGRAAKLLKGIGEWCIRYTPIVALDPPDGLMLDISGCAHLWGGEQAYLKEILTRLRALGYDVRAAIASTIGAAWGISRFGRITAIVECGDELAALQSLPPAALRLEPGILQKLQKLGLHTIGHFIHMPRSALRRRFGTGLLMRLDQALGQEEEALIPLQPVTCYAERLPCLEPIRTATGIEIAIQRLLEALCERLQKEGKGLRTAVLSCYRIDGKILQTAIGTNRASHHASHLFKLFEIHIASIEPDLGIELFVMEAQKVEEVDVVQEKLWMGQPGLQNSRVAELLDRLAGKVGAGSIHRYLPQEHYWPERSIRPAVSLEEKPGTAWRKDRIRPIRLLARPESIEVTAPIPDYPPMLFIYQNKRHKIRKADGPERIEREWWLESGEHRDYYCVEDEEGRRYWLFRSGHYAGDRGNHWFIHGFFA